MDPMSLDDLLMQLGLPPQGPELGVAPPVPVPQAPQPFTPYDTSVVPGTAFGAPYGGTPLPLPTDMGAMHVPREEATPVDTGYGYTPQARPALPSQLGTEGINPDLFNTYRNLYSPAAPEEDVLTRLLGDTTQGMPGFRQEPPPSRALTPPGMGGGPRPQYGAQGPMGMTDSERRLRARGPEFNRVADRFHELNAMRARRGF